MKRIILFCLLTLLCAGAYAQNMGGIGAQLLLDTAGGSTMPRIMSLVPGSPADSFLKATDFIMSVNGVSCKDKNIQEVVMLIRGEAGTKVHVMVADTKEGKRPREYDLVRAGIPGMGSPQQSDPTAAFNDWAEKEAEMLKLKKFTVVKTFNATCGDRYFNFVADARQYHILVMTMGDTNTGTSFTTTARVFDNDNEAGATAITHNELRRMPQMDVNELSGDVAFAKQCVSVVNVRVAGADTSHCHGLYVIVYR